jgi:hypothetical protein
MMKQARAFLERHALFEHPAEPGGGLPLKMMGAWQS